MYYGRMGNRPLFPPFGGSIPYDSFMNQIEKTFMTFPSIILDVLIDEFDADYSQEFMDEMGIVKYNKLESIKDGIDEIQLFFKNKESLDNYVEEYDLYDYVA